jgi:hypothetical protein
VTARLQPQVFVARFQAPPGTKDSIRKLRWTLKGLLRGYGWDCLSIEPERIVDNGEAAS